MTSTLITPTETLSNLATTQVGLVCRPTQALDGSEIQRSSWQSAPATDGLPVLCLGPATPWS